MRFSTFVPAALAFLAATTSALPTVTDQIRDVSLNKRGRNLVDLVGPIFVKAWTKIDVDVCTHLTTDICADLNVELNAKANVLGGLVTADADVDKLKVSVKAHVNAEVKAIVKAELDAVVKANIDTHVANVLAILCPTLSLTCLDEKAHQINADVWAKVKLDIEKVIVKVRANVRAHVETFLKAKINELAVNAGVANAKVTARVFLKAQVDTKLKVLIDICAKLWAKVTADLKLGAL
ncbi:hypothetical protein BGW42_003443 [Actinomortierella wolfii]|nr:hypothetical protein BGW42_003443 [Actinomortierella wolfii]